MPDPLLVEIARHLACLPRIEAMLMAVLERPPADSSANLQSLDDSPLDLLSLLASWSGGWFTSGEVWAQASGEPDLARALADACIRTPHGLGRWLPKQGEAVERQGDLWRINGFGRHETGETD